MMENETLKLTTPMMHGPAVVRLQEMLHLLAKINGFEIDGIYGKETMSAVKLFQRGTITGEVQRLKDDGICGPKTWKAIIEECNKSKYKHNGETVVTGALLDRSDLHPHPKLYKCKRPWSQITGVTLHQTGCAMPSNPAGWDRVNAHFGVTQSGIAIMMNYPEDFIWHAQGLSAATIGIEIEGNYCGIDGDLKTLWKGGGGPHHLNPGMISALERIRLYLVDEFAANKSQWKNIFVSKIQNRRSR